MSIKASKEKNVFFVILLVVTAASVLNWGSYAVPAFLEYIRDDSFEYELYMADLGGFALAAVIFVLLVICFRTKRRNLLLPAAALFVIETVFLDGYAAPVCCAVLCLMAFLQERDERSGLVPAAAVLLYVVMLFFWVVNLIRDAVEAQSDVLYGESSMGWYYLPAIVLFAAAAIIMGKSIRKKRSAGIKVAAAAYLAGEISLMVIMVPIYGLDEVVTDSFVMLGFGLLTWIFCSPAILISLYLIFRKNGDAHELKTDTD